MYKQITYFMQNYWCFTQKVSIETIPIFLYNKNKWPEVNRGFILFLGQPLEEVIRNPKNRLVWQSHISKYCTPKSKPFDGIPLINAGRMFYTCHQGRDKDAEYKKRKRQSTVLKQVNLKPKLHCKLDFQRINRFFACCNAN